MPGLLLGAATTTASDWPQFLGPRRDGTTADERLAEGWLRSDLRTVWRGEVGEGYSGLAVAGDALYGMEKSGTDERVFARRASDGSPRWTLRAELAGVAHAPLQQLRSRRGRPLRLRQRAPRAEPRRREGPEAPAGAPRPELDAPVGRGRAPVPAGALRARLPDALSTIIFSTHREPPHLSRRSHQQVGDRNYPRFTTLGRAFAMGYPDRDAIEKDADLASLRADPRAKQLAVAR